MWIYEKTEAGIFTVGFYRPNGTFVAESDHSITEKAAARCHYLNGGEEETTWCGGPR